MARKSTHITKVDDINCITSLKEEDITMSTIFDMFGEFNGKIKYHPYDTFDVPIGSYGPEGRKNKNVFTTTVGIYVFNVFMIENKFFDLFQYINETVDGDVLEDITGVITRAVQEDKYSTASLDEFLQKCQFLMPTTTALTESGSEKLYSLSEYIMPKKKALAKKYEKELSRGDAAVSEAMEKELIEEAMNYLEDDPALDIYLSKARSSIGNNLKCMYIMKGAITNPDTKSDQKFFISTSSYNDGIPREEYPLLCKSLATGPYSRSRKTALGGYWEKLFVMAYQDVVIGGPNTDCGTTDTIPILLTKKNLDSWMYSYIQEKGGKLVELTIDNQDKYLNKVVNFRFSIFCEDKKCICNKCAGNSFYRLGVTNIGVAMGMIASDIKNINMKAFHDGTVSTITIDPKKAFGM